MKVWLEANSVFQLIKVLRPHPKAWAGQLPESINRKQISIRFSEDKQTSIAFGYFCAVVPLPSAWVCETTVTGGHKRSVALPASLGPPRPGQGQPQGLGEVGSGRRWPGHAAGLAEAVTGAVPRGARRWLGAGAEQWPKVTLRLGRTHQFWLDSASAGRYADSTLTITQCLPNLVHNYDFLSL